jgi:hypothetical protein
MRASPARKPVALFLRSRQLLATSAATRLLSGLLVPPPGLPGKPAARLVFRKAPSSDHRDPITVSSGSSIRHFENLGIVLVDPWQAP